MVARPGIGWCVDQDVPAGAGGPGSGHHRRPGAASPVAARSAGRLFVLALWLFRGPNCGYGRVMVKLVDTLYHRRRGEQLLGGVLDPDGWVEAGDGRRWRPPNISSLSRARTRLGADPLHMLFDEVAGPVGAPDAAAVFCCGLRVVSMDGSTTDVPDSTANAEYFGRPSNATRDGAFPQVRWIVAAESGPGELIGPACAACGPSSQHGLGGLDHVAGSLGRLTHGVQGRVPVRGGGAVLGAPQRFRDRLRQFGIRRPSGAPR